MRGRGHLRLGFVGSARNGFAADPARTSLLWLFAVLLWLIVALLWLGCSNERSTPDTQSVYGVQLHVHGSMSEGPASMRAHTIAAAELDGAVDVIWWTDHDWRIAGHTYVTGFDFEQGLVEYESLPAALRMAQFDGREPLPSWAAERGEGAVVASAGVERVRKGFVVRHMPTADVHLRMQVTDREARSGNRSLHLSVEGTGSARDRLVLGFEATRRRQIASLASGVTLRISILPAIVEGDARLVLTVSLSQPRPGERARIDYVLKKAKRAAPPGEGSVELRPMGEGAGQVRVATIPVPTEPGVWNDWVLDLSGDATRYGLGGADNSLVDLQLSVEVGRSDRLEVDVDSLAIDRARLGEALFEAERDLARELSTDALTHHVGQEISYAAHLNAYGAAVPLADARRYPHGLSPREAVAFVHEHGGLISLNHYFGTEFSMISHRFPRSRVSFDASLARLIENRAFGVDLLEVGYRSRGYGLAAFLELWDGLSLAGIHVVGVGVSDSHDAEVGWRRGPNNFITWIYADSKSESDLLAGLRAGRAFFGDPTLFDGELDITTAGGGRMGDVLAVSPGTQRIRLRADRLREGQRVRVIRDGREIAVYTPETDTIRVEREIFVDAPSFVRFEVVADGEPIALSNPIHFVLEASP